MEDQYLEIRDYLRKQHNANVSEVRGREHGNTYVYHYDDTMDDADTKNHDRRPSAFSNLVFLGKVFVFLAAVLLFSFYLYGGQDLKKGAKMALRDANVEIVKLENENETVKETMGYVRTALHKTKDFVGEYIDIDFKENNMTDSYSD